MTATASQSIAVAAAGETGTAASQVLASVSEPSRRSTHLDAEMARIRGTLRAA